MTEAGNIKITITSVVEIIQLPASSEYKSTSKQKNILMLLVNGQNFFSLPQVTMLIK